MKLLVEMTEQEFETYKGFLNGDYVKKEDYVDVPLFDILKQRGFKVVFTDSHFDKMKCKTFSCVGLKNENAEITIQGYEDSF